MRGFFQKLGFGSGGHDTPEDPELKHELERFERLKKSLTDLEIATIKLKSASLGFGKAIEEIGEALSNSMLWPDAKCKDLSVFSLTRNKSSIVEDTIGKQMMRMKKSLSQKIQYTKALDKGIKIHKKVKSKHDRVLHRIDVLKLKLKNGRAEELAHIVDASILDKHMQRKFHSEFSELKELEKRKKKLTVELREDTRAMVAALRSSHTQMHRYCEATSRGLEKSIVSYLHSSNQHVLQDVDTLPEKKKSNVSNEYDTQGRRAENGAQFRTSTSALRSMHKKNDEEKRDGVPIRPPRSDPIRPPRNSPRLSEPESLKPSRPPRKMKSPKPSRRVRQSVRLPQGLSPRSGKEFYMSTSELRKKHSNETFVPESYDLYEDSMTPKPKPPTRVSSAEHQTLRAEMIAASQDGDYERAGVIQELLKAAELIEHDEEEEEEEQTHHQKRHRLSTSGRELFMMNVVDNL